MADNLMASLINELDQYIRERYILRIAEMAPEYPVYTNLVPWDTDGAGMFLPLIRKSQGRQADPMEIKDESDSISYQKIKGGRTRDLQNPIMYATGLSFSLNALKMGLTRLSSTKRIPELFADAVRLTREYYNVRLLNEAESTSAPAEMIGYDAKPLISATHALQGSADAVSNYYSTISGVTYTALNAMLDMCAEITDEEGNPYPMYRIDKLYIPPQEELNAYETLKSLGRPDVLGNAQNVLNSRAHFGLTPDGVKTLYYMTNDRWFAVDSAHNEVERYELMDTGVEGPFVDEVKTKDVSWNQLIWIHRSIWDWRGILMAKRSS